MFRNPIRFAQLALTAVVPVLLLASVTAASATPLTFTADDKVHNWDFGGAFGSPDTYRFTLAFEQVNNPFAVDVSSEPFNSPLPPGYSCVPFVGTDVPGGCRQFDVTTAGLTNTSATGPFHVQIAWANDTQQLFPGTGSGRVDLFHFNDHQVLTVDTTPGSYFDPPDGISPECGGCEQIFTSEPLDPASQDQFKNSFLYFLYLLFYDLNRYLGVPFPDHFPDPGVSGTEDTLEFSPFYVGATTVPEPTTLVLLGSGVVSAWIARRRAKRPATTR